MDEDKQDLVEVSRDIDIDVPADYNGLSTLMVNDVQKSKLNKDFSEKEIQVRPDGIIYLPQTFFRKCLNEAFGQGQWALKRLGITVNSSQNYVYYQGQLFVKGHFVAESIGEQEFFGTTYGMSYGTATEAAKSDCITRCCKDLGIAWQLWNPEFVEFWLEKFAEKIEVIHAKKRSRVKIWLKKSAKNLPYGYEEIPEDKPGLDIPDNVKEVFNEIKNKGLAKSTILDIAHSLNGDWLKIGRVARILNYALRGDDDNKGS
jgi:hypothetical protein